MTSYGDRDGERSDLRQAYERGRRDARKERRRHPFLMALIVIAALIGVALLVLALINGSFGGAGAIVDRRLSTAADQAKPMVRDAATQAGEAVRDATTSDGTQAPATN